jgi:hypothetical protein
MGTGANWDKTPSIRGIWRAHLARVRSRDKSVSVRASNAMTRSKLNVARRGTTHACQMLCASQLREGPMILVLKRMSMTRIAALDLVELADRQASSHLTDVQMRTGIRIANLGNRCQARLLPVKRLRIKRGIIRADSRTEDNHQGI